jgi:hypothetical protein
MVSERNTEELKPMTSRLLALVKPFALSLFALALLAVAQGEARADEVFIAGYTNGCFNCVTPPNSSATQGDTLAGLTYTNATFSGTTADGFLAFGGFPGNVVPPPGTQGVNNLGYFTLTGAPNTYTGNTFTLRVTFTAPEGITGSNTQTFTALVTGTVRSETDGGVRLDFDNTPITFVFNDTNCQPTTIPGQQTTCGSGSFQFRINDLSINPGQTAALSGDILSAEQTTVPEPATLLLLGTGLSGIAAGVRRRRNRAAQK